jgi:hypothetical protein
LQQNSRQLLTPACHVSHCYSLLLLLVPLHDIIIRQLASKDVQGTAYCNVHAALASCSYTLQISLCGREGGQVVSAATLEA